MYPCFLFCLALILFQKPARRTYPDYLYNLIHHHHPGPYSLRNSHTLVPRFARLSISQNSYFPSTTREWNRLPLKVQNSLSVSMFKRLLTNSSSNLYVKSTRGKTGVWLTRLRMELSPLHSHRYRYNFIQFPTCPFCNSGSETNFHFFFICPAHRLDRLSLFKVLSNDLSLDTLKI